MSKSIYVLKMMLLKHHPNITHWQTEKEMEKMALFIAFSTSNFGDLGFFKSVSRNSLIFHWNSRIVNHTGLLEHDKSNGHLPFSNDYISNDFLPRKSEDKSTHPYESEFLSLVLNYNLIILDGRTLGDLGGSFTCIKPNGSSVFDYFMVSKNIADNFKLLKVLASTPYSDHKPLILTLPTQKLNLSISRPLREIYDVVPSEFIFDDNILINFIDLQNLT